MDVRLGRLSFPPLGAGRNAAAVIEMKSPSSDSRNPAVDIDAVDVVDGRRDLAGAAKTEASRD